MGVAVVIDLQELLMLSLSSELDTRCFALFVQCDEFDSARLLRSVFTTNDLAAFTDSLPDKTGSKKAFVTEVKSFLLDKRLADGRVLLLPFLDTLRGRYSQQEALHGELNDLYLRVLAIPEAAAAAEPAREVQPAPAGPGDSPAAAQGITPVQLLPVLNVYFDIGDLKALCFELGLDYDNLEGNTKKGKSLALIQYCQRHGRFLELVQQVQKDRPNATF
jgi:hypothetical protein